MTFHPVASLDQLEQLRPLRVQVGTEEIVLVRQGERVRAFQANCPHEGAPLEQGAVCGGLLICPWHKAAFAVDDGVALGRVEAMEVGSVGDLCIGHPRQLSALALRRNP